MSTSHGGILTIGHSTKSWQDFVDLLEEHQISTLVDIRRFPGSRRYPHFNKGKMETRLPDYHISYLHLEALGGRREPHKDSRNCGWRNPSFRGYADHMATDEFRSGVDQLLSLYKAGRVTIMCAEALPWQCHRSLVSDYLVCIFNLNVQHIMPDGRLQTHSVTQFAQVADSLLSYPKGSAA